MRLAYIGIDLLCPALAALHGMGCEIAEIFTCKTDNETEFNLKVTEFAKQHKIPYTMNRITREDISRLKENGCKFAVCGGYYYRIPVDEAFPIVNIHPSLLPQGRGSWPMPIAILRQLPASGITLHKVAEGFDTGDILLQESFPLSGKENLDTFMEKACSLLPGLMETLVRDFDALWANALPQGEGEYLEAPTEADWTVTNETSFKDADRILRAFYGYECIYAGPAGKYRLIRGQAIPCAERQAQPALLPIRGGYVISELLEPLSAAATPSAD